MVVSCTDEVITLASYHGGKRAAHGQQHVKVGGVWRARSGEQGRGQAAIGWQGSTTARRDHACMQPAPAPERCHAPSAGRAGSLRSRSCRLGSVADGDAPDFAAAALDIQARGIYGPRRREESCGELRSTRYLRDFDLLIFFFFLFFSLFFFFPLPTKLFPNYSQFIHGIAAYPRNIVTVSKMTKLPSGSSLFGLSSLFQRKVSFSSLSSPL